MYDVTFFTHKEVGMPSLMEYIDNLIAGKHFIYGKISHNDKRMLTALFYLTKSEREQREDFLKADREFQYNRIAIEILMNTGRPIDIWNAIEDNFINYYEEQISEIFNKRVFEHHMEEDAKNHQMIDYFSGRENHG